MFETIYAGSGLKVIGEFVQVLFPTYDKICLSNFDLQKGNFNFLLQQRIATPLSSTGQKSSLKYSGHWLL